MSEQFDLLVIGGGPGVRFVRSGSAAGLKTGCIESRGTLEAHV